MANAGWKLQLKTVVFVTCIIAGILFFSVLAVSANPTIAVKPVIAEMKMKAAVFSKSCDDLQQAVIRLNLADPLSIRTAREALISCRYHYKEIEFFLEYFFIRSARTYNGPPKIELEESETGYQQPVGFQQMEAILFAPDIQKQKLVAHATVVCNSARELPALLDQFETSDRQILQSLRLELIRVMTLGITGYDAPLLKSGITESCYALRSVQKTLAPLLQTRPSTELGRLLVTSIAYLQRYPDFDRFNRMQFLTWYALPLQEQLDLYIRRWGMQLATGDVFNHLAKNLFSHGAFNQQYFDNPGINNREMIALGRQLFFEKGLSGPGTRSCASCHQPERYFTDGLPKSVAIDGQTHVLRNAPTLLYAGLQYSQFWDARAKSLTEQIAAVLNNKTEMAGEPGRMITRLSASKDYRNLFKSAFQKEPGSAVTFDGITTSMAAYICSLSPQNSAFDRYMAGNKQALTNRQIQGFNLFMGKAQCGTCHFAPLFNGLIPPLYKTTELEIIGVPLTADQHRVQADTDEGRYRITPISFFKGAFKTPTIRNVAKTGPYMHNGSFPTLEKVLDFYNGGGGNGWGLNNTEQTLSSDSLKLNRKEIKDIIAFLDGLTDKLR